MWQNLANVRTTNKDMETHSARWRSLTFGLGCLVIAAVGGCSASDADATSRPAQTRPSGNAGTPSLSRAGSSAGSAGALGGLTTPIPITGTAGNTAGDRRRPG
jgi:hypothetical protein